MTGTRVALVTAPSEEVARSLARTLVEERLAACGNLVPGITSIYRWEEELQEDAEVLLIFKVHESCVDAFVQRVPELHPYDVPEVLVLDVGAGHPPYLNWVATESTGPV